MLLLLGVWAIFGGTAELEQIAACAIVQARQNSN